MSAIEARTFVHNFKHALDSIYTNNYQSIFILGDFNFPNISWIDGSYFSNLSTNDENKFVDILKDLFLFQLIDSPTRANKILDLILINSPDEVTSIQTGASLQDIAFASDHYPVIFDIIISYFYKSNAKRQIYNFKNANFENINKAFHLTPLSSGFLNFLPKRTLIQHGICGMTLYSK